MVETRMPSNKDHLVTVTESCVDAEISAWMKSTATRRKGPAQDDSNDHDGKEKSNN